MMRNINFIPLWTCPPALLFPSDRLNNALQSTKVLLACRRLVSLGLPQLRHNTPKNPERNRIIPVKNGVQQGVRQEKQG
jgi:hypothetical protein